MCVCMRVDRKSSENREGVSLQVFLSMAVSAVFI